MVIVKKIFYNINNYSIFRSIYTSSPINKVYPINSIKYYSDCDVEKKSIFAYSRTQRNTGVIYCWVNNLNMKCYVGSSTDLTTRLYKYYSIKQLYKSKSAIYSALLKYGYSNFSLHILEYCSKNECIKREQHYIDLYKPEYNILKKAGSSHGFKHNESTLKLLRETRVTKETRKNLSLAASKRSFSDKEKEKLSNIRLGIKLPLFTRTKISVTATKLWGVAVDVEDIESGITEQFTSLTFAANSIKVSRTAVKKALLSGRFIKNRWKVTYTEKKI